MERVTQRSRVAGDLLNSIRDKKFPVGSKLPSERLLAEEYGVSRPVIREALGMLSSLDVVEIQMGRGAFVLNGDVSVQNDVDYRLVDIVDAREAIEAGALRLAVQRARRTEKQAVQKALTSLEDSVALRQETTEPDMALHRAIIGAARSPLLAKLWDDMTEEIAHTVRISPHGKAMSPDILTGHRDLAGGVVDADLPRALGACERLYEDHRKFLRSLLG